MANGTRICSLILIWLALEGLAPLPQPAAPGAGPQQPVTVTRHDDARRVDILVGGKPFTSYIYPTTLKKPVLFPLRTAKGTLVTRGFPIERRQGEATDHPHQVGAWFTYGDVNGIDFWGYSDATPPKEVPQKGTIVHKAITRTLSGADRGELAVTADWVMPDGSTILQEETLFTFRGTADSRTVDRVTRWTARGKRVVFGDTKEGAFGIRVARSLEHPSGVYRSSEGRTGEAVWGTRGRWMILTGTVDHEPVTLGILDHPTNPGYPTYWHARGYGLFAANPFGQSAFTNSKERMNFALEPGESATFRHRIVILPGTASAAQMDSEHQDFTRTSRYEDSVHAQAGERPRLSVKPAADFEVTGTGEHAGWRQTEWTALRRRDPAGHPYDSRFKMLYSSTGLYFLMEGTDRRLTATMNEDFMDLWKEDVFEVFLWTDERYPMYFEYEISPLNRELPILIPNFGGQFLGWRPWHYVGDRLTRKATSIIDGPKESNASIQGWRAEFFIPYTLLKPLQNVPPKPGSAWRANFYRMDYDDGKSTQWEWAQVGKSFHEYEKFGDLLFMDR